MKSAKLKLGWGRKALIKMIWKETIHISRQQRTGLVGLKNGHFANVQYCIYADSTPLVGGSEKAQNYADVIYGWSPTIDPLFYFPFPPNFCHVIDKWHISHTQCPFCLILSENYEILLTSKSIKLVSIPSNWLFMLAFVICNL